MKWNSVFDEAQPDEGATEAEIARFVATIGLPLSASEIEGVNRSQQNPFPPGDPLHGAYRAFDAASWIIPSRPLPQTYLEFLRWSNGGWFRSGEREFGFFPTASSGSGVRDMLLAYHVPEYMPGALPIAFNGGGTFYLLDMREPPVEGEYPVVCAHAGSLSWKRTMYSIVADSFPNACRGTTNVDDLPRE